MIHVQYFKTENDLAIAFFPFTRRSILVDKEAQCMIDDMISGVEKSRILQSYGVSEEDYSTFVNCIFPSHTTQRNPISASSPQEKLLNRLVIHLSNDCNLRCEYCYANGGVYRSAQDLLSREMLDRILDVFFREYDRIGRIQFFGGEPLMNMDVLEYACARFRELDQARGTKTSLGLVTNGTLINERFIDLVNQYHLSVTVSYDGDPEVNDCLRVFPNGSGCSKLVLENIRMLRAAAKQPDTIEVTYTQRHVDAGVSILDITRSLRRQFPGIRIHVAPAAGDPSHSFVLKDMRPFADSIAELSQCAFRCHEDPSPSFEIADQIFADLETEDAPIRFYICGAGLTTLSVSTKGEIYPCFMLTDQKEMCLGSVMEDDVFHSRQYRAVLDQLLTFSNRQNHKECRDCFLDPFCSGCIGLNNLVEGKPFQLSPKICSMKKTMTEEAIRGLAKADEAGN